jgi:hypothetical protein
LIRRLLVAQTELRVLYNTTETEMISSDALLAAIIELSEGVEPPKPIPSEFSLFISSRRSLTPRRDLAERLRASTTSDAGWNPHCRS